jgi:hypothetical protein
MVSAQARNTNRNLQEGDLVYTEKQKKQYQNS